MILENLPEIQKLSYNEKLVLAEELWDETAQIEAEYPPEEWVIKILEEREEEYRRNPKAVVTWEEVKARARASRKS